MYLVRHGYANDRSRRPVGLPTRQSAEDPFLPHVNLMVWKWKIKLANCPRAGEGGSGAGEAGHRSVPIAAISGAGGAASAEAAATGMVPVRLHSQARPGWRWDAPFTPVYRR